MDMHKIIGTLCICICLALCGNAAKAETTTMNTEGLNIKQQSIVTIAAFTARGDMERLIPALHEGLDAGLTINEIKEVLVQLYAYCGFPRSLNALGVFMEVVERRKEQGKNDQTGKEASPFPTDKTRLELGTEIQTKLAGAPVKGPLFDFAPAIDTFLKEHLFSDIFGRDSLDWQSREIATVAALASMDGVNPQLRAHLGISVNIGFTEAQLHGLIEVLGHKVGKKEGENARAALIEVLTK